MAFKEFVKNNLVLISGIVLPLLLMMFFLMATFIPRMSLTAPKYDFLFSMEDYKSHSNPYIISVKSYKKRIRARVHIAEKDQGRRILHIFRYHADSNSISEVDFDPPLDVTPTKKGADFTIEDLQNLIIDKKLLSPDGYMFDYSYNYNGGFTTWFFGGNRRRHGYRLHKDGIAFKVPFFSQQAHRSYYSNSFQFIGWIIDEQE